MASQTAQYKKELSPPAISVLFALFLAFALTLLAPVQATAQDTAGLRVLVNQDADIRGESATTVIQLAQDLPRELREALRNRGFKVVMSAEKPFDVEARLTVDTELYSVIMNAWVLFKKSTLTLVQDDQVLIRVEYLSDTKAGNYKTYGAEGAQYARTAAEALAAKLVDSPSFASVARTARVNSPAATSSREPEVARRSSAPAVARGGTSDVDQVPQATIKKKKDAYAIVIGIEEYRQKLPRADFAANDAQTMANYLIHVLGYPEENVIILINDRALKSDMEKYFEQWLTNNVEPQSSVFIYYSGHGAPDPRTGSAYLVPYDGDPTFIKQTGYSLKRMYEVLNKLQNRETIVALDSCFSGAGGRSVLAKGSRPLVMNLKTTAPLAKNVVVLSASSGDQISSSYDDKGHGLFTYFLLKGMKEEDVVGQNGNLNVKELFSYLKPQVSRISRKIYNNEQTPQLFQGNGKSEE